MSKWEMVKLGDVANIQSGGTPSRNKSEYWDGGEIPWVKIGDFNGKYLNKTKEYITFEGLGNSSARLFQKNTILYTIFATLGEVSILDIEACTNQAIAGIQICNNDIDIDFLYYALKANKNKIVQSGRGVAQNNINLGILKNLEIPLPPLEKQKKIADELDKITDLIAKRKLQLEKLDLLVKAKFVEMFGDPVENPMGWKPWLLEEVSDIVSGITKGRKTKNSELIEVPYMAVSNVKDGYIDWTMVKTIAATIDEIKQYRILPNDVLMTEGGDPDKLGRGAIIVSPPENCIHQNHIYRVRVEKSLLSEVYFSHYLRQHKAKQYFLRCAKQTTGIATVNKTQLKALPVLLPPLELQNQFAQYVETVEQTKAKMEQGLQQLELLYAERMQGYFE